ncbi:hypothetical protein [Ornithobacterium rhinotracheale]|uniref:hypothetical protein n=1 Tax=Ornithobacterium rhinotracheale TaxID=28251 RepID=UPI001FF5F811|nr:hypothetical protein [Ornithobacterium rhinotracheale]MCK0195199.1 hypothetical protein [Ornithobacterium rhinotracheale]
MSLGRKEASPRSPTVRSSPFHLLLIHIYSASQTFQLFHQGKSWLKEEVCKKAEYMSNCKEEELALQKETLYKILDDRKK